MATETKRKKAMSLPVLVARPGILQEQDMFEGGNGFCDEFLFNRMLGLERKRAERSRKPFILILIDITGLMNAGPPGGVDKLQKALSTGFRETDFLGWYRRGSVIGIVFTGLHSVGNNTRTILFGKLMAALASRIESDTLQKIYITFHTCPASHEDAISCGRFDLGRYQVPTHQIADTPFPSRMKRLPKAMGGLTTLTKLLPIFFSHPPSKR
jgi:hypothetical protein